MSSDTQSPTPRVNAASGERSSERVFMEALIYGSSFVVEARFRPLHVVGSGAYGSVCVVRDDETETFYAIKKTANVFDRPDFARRTLREVRLLRLLDHENIVNIEDVYCSGGESRDFGDVFMRMEMMDTDLHALLHKASQTITEAHHRFFMAQ
eukprot:Cvel_34396.t1-p1 / transcript=Cvel_34396.t1 / gene=Cvel_34396 / organism=Chromera_velia_CCMP2878 / gene_product=Mitogen-activated protein kinase 3, putative / transcript_product=Mitogen-activated protein kinase 3, putative / location=Cvel_scaffold5896:3208-4011(+) / protein_length=152 / sequence_SO=supercontig / SO=protein_coding / is_pseudo=false